MSHFPPVYLTIDARTNAPRRLESLRARAANNNVPDWRTVRAWTFANGAAAHCTLSQGFNTSDNGPFAPKRAIWYCHTGPQFRDEKFCDEVEEARIDHEGWFKDEDQNGKIRGIVARLSHGRYLAGYYSSDNDERVYLDRIYTDAKEAARAADSEAERVADDEREYNERWQEKRDIEDDITARKTRVSELFALRNNPHHRDTARDELAEVCAIIRKIRADLAANYSDVE